MSNENDTNVGSEKPATLPLLLLDFPNISSFWLLVLREALVYISSLFLLAEETC